MAGLKEYAEEYVRRIKTTATDGEDALALMKEFGEKAYSMGWDAACRRVRVVVVEMMGE